MNEELKTAFREIFFLYGAALLESERLVNYLSDWQIGIDKPTKNVVRVIVNQGYGKKIFEKAKVGDLKFSESKYFAKKISDETGFMPELVKKVIESIFYGLSIEEQHAISDSANKISKSVNPVDSSSMVLSEIETSQTLIKAEAVPNFTIKDIIASGYKPAGKLIVNPNTNELYDVYFHGIGILCMNLVYIENNKYHRKEIAEIYSATSIWKYLANGNFSVIQNIECVHGYCSIIHVSYDKMLVNRFGDKKTLSEILADSKDIEKRNTSLMAWRIDYCPIKAKIWIEKNVHQNEIWVDFAGKELKCTLSDTCDLVNLLNSDHDFELIECARDLIFVVRKSDIEYDPWIFDTKGNLTNKQMPTSSYNSRFSTNDLLTIEGITLGKTTWNEATKLGYNVETHKSSVGNAVYRVINMHSGIALFDFSNSGVFSDLFITRHNKVTQRWVSTGFDFSMSYRLWMAWLNSNDFRVVVKKEPRIKLCNGLHVLDAEIEAFDSNSIAKLRLNFNFGHDGCTQDSLNTLYSIDIETM